MLPSLQLPGSGVDAQGARLLGMQEIPGWVDGVLGVTEVEKRPPFEGYVDEAAMDESRAWVALLEGPIHAALVSASLPTTTTSISLFRPQASRFPHASKKIFSFFAH